MASVWKDTKLVSFLSTQSNPVSDVTVNTKQRDGSLVEVSTVPATISYNKNMGDVDFNDQHRKYYSVGRKSRKWWHYLLWFLVDVSIINGHILECEAQNHLSRSQMDFRLELAKKLIGNFSSRFLSVADGKYGWTLAQISFKRTLQENTHFSPSSEETLFGMFSGQHGKIVTRKFN